MKFWTLAILFVLSAALAQEAKVEKVRSYNEGPAFCMVVGVSTAYHSNVSAYLKNEGGEIVRHWADKLATAGENKEITYKQDFSTLPAGRYDMLVLVKDYNGKESTLWSTEIVHRTGAFLQPSGTKDILADDGTILRSFSFRYAASTKTRLKLEIKTQEGHSIRHAESIVENSAFGDFIWNWDLRQDDGTPLLPGTYVLYYQIGDEPASKLTFEI